MRETVLSVPTKAFRLLLIGAAVLVAALSFAYVGGWLSTERLTQTQMISAFEAANGAHPGFRRNHAKGICFSGRFDSSGAAAEWSSAAVFKARSSTVVGRFALAGGMPFQADLPATVRSMALRFMPGGGGGEWRTGMNDIPVFPVNSAAAFYEQLIASSPVAATDKADPAAMAAFLSRHPETARALALLKARTPTVGFADSTFNSLDAFFFVDHNGRRSAVRWAAVPMQEAVLQADSPDDDAKRTTANNRLFDELILQQQEKPLQWHLVVTLGQPQDVTADATLAWPRDRPHVDAGIITVEQLSSEEQGVCTDINFDPLVLPAGIAPSDDPLLSARSAVYARSVTLRLGERGAKPPSAVTVAEVQRGVTP